MRSNLLFKAGWLRAFFDGEGTVVLCKRPYRTKKGTRYSKNYFISATNTDSSIMNFCRAYLSDFGIEHTLYRPTKEKAHYKQQTTIMISKASAILLFHKVIGFGSHIKRRKLKEIIRWIGNRPSNGINKNYSSPSFFRSIHPNVLAKMYFEDQLSCEEIAKTLGLPIGSKTKIATLIKEHCQKPLRGPSERRKLAASKRPVGGFGESARSAKLTNKDVHTIIGLLQSNMSCASIARMYDVGSTAIERIKNNKTWKHIRRHGK